MTTDNNDPNPQTPDPKPDAATDAMQIAPIMFDAAEWKDRILEAYRPKGISRPEAAVEKIMGYILKLDPDEHPPQKDPLRRYIDELSGKKKRVKKYGG